MNEGAPQPIRCTACGTPNFPPATRCLACDTFLPRGRPVAVAAVVPALAAGPWEDEAWSRVRGVGYLFLGALALTVGAVIANRLGAAEAHVDLGQSVVLMAVVALTTVLAWPDLRGPLSRLGGLRAIAAAAVGFVVLLAFGWLYFSAVRQLGIRIFRSTDPYLEAGWSPLAAYALVAVVPGIFEELAFRGYVMARLDRLFTPSETLLVQAALFSVLHFAIVSFVSHFVIGLVLGLLRRRTGSLYPGMLVHFSWNALVLSTELAGVTFP